MSWYKKISDFIREEQLLVSLLAFTLLLRMAGLMYGLPLQVVNDESPFTLGALKMMQLKTLLPALHVGDFQGILYYPPLGSYLLLLPFTLIVGVKYALFAGDPAQFSALISSDMSPFFITARLVSILLAVLSVYLTYRIAQTLFNSRVAAIAASFLLATSLLHVSLSMVGRNWIMASFVFLLVLFVLTKRDWSMARRYLYVFIIAGIGVGFNPFSIFSLVMAGLYYLFFDVKNPSQIMRDLPRMIVNMGIFAVLFLIQFAIWHGGNNFTGSLTVFQDKTLLGFFISPWSALSLIAYSEPVLALLFVTGLVLMLVHLRRLGAFIVSWLAFNLIIFYFIFRFDARFLLPVLPLFAIIAGYGISRVWHLKAVAVVCLALLTIPLASSVRLAYLAMEGDSRQHAREWVENNVTSSDKVLVFSAGIHVPTLASAADELKRIDPSAVRAANEADAVLDRKDVPYILNNVTSITNSEFIRDFPQYAKGAGFNYVVVEPKSYGGLPAELTGAIQEIVRDAEVVAEYKGFGSDLSVVDSAYYRPFWELFDNKVLGYDILIYHVR